MNLKKHFTIALFYSILTIGMFFGLQYIFAWTNPTLNPPSGNVSPAINEGTTAQVKDGSLGISDNFVVGGLASFSQIEFGGETNDSWPTVPAGAVMAFDLSACPDGWTELTSARGRVIVGLNPSDSSFDTLSETGGEKTHTLTTAEMPSHNHTSAMMSFVGANGVSMANGTGGQGWPTSTGAGHLTTSTGGNQAHNNLQPYITFIYCKKN